MGRDMPKVSEKQVIEHKSKKDNEPADEMDIPRKPVELRDRDRAFAFAGHVESACQLRPKLERVRSLVGLILVNSATIGARSLARSTPMPRAGLKPKAQSLLP